MHYNWRAARAPHTWGKACRAMKTQQRQQNLQRKLERILQIFFWAVMAFGFKGKRCSLVIKSMDTVNVYTLIFIYILIHGSWCWEIGGAGRVDTNISDVSGDKYPGKHNTKNSHTQKDSHYSLYIEINPVPCTQTYTNNHNIASSRNYSNQPHCSNLQVISERKKLLSITRAPILIPSRNLESVCPLH